MVGIEFPEIISFLRQASVAVVGASAMYGFIFSWRRYPELVRTVQPVLMVSAVVFIGIWLMGASLHIPRAFAHVGIALEPRAEDLTRAYLWQVPLVAILATLVATGERLMRTTPKAYFGSIFVVVSILISTYAISDRWDVREITYILHGWHSILTLGSVILLDYLFFKLHNSKKGLKELSKNFQTITAGIFVGLGIDIASTYLILDEALRLDQRFFFMQTVVAILLINGILLSGPMTERALRYMRRRKPLPLMTALILGLMGSISIISWLTITFLDVVPRITLSYSELALAYAAVIAFAFTFQFVVEGRKMVA